MKPLFNSRAGAAVLGLSFDGSRLEGVCVRRSNGSVEVRQTFAASLSLDPLTNDAELVGREIRKHLDEAGIRERRCAVGIPLGWALTLQVKLPDLPEADLEGFLHLEAERGFPYGPDTLMIASSRFRTPSGESFATLVAVPRDHVVRLEAALAAAQLRPVTFSLGITALQGRDGEAGQGLLALWPGEQSVGLEVRHGGGIAVLRTIHGVHELEGGAPQLQGDAVARELRITLGQLPPDLRQAVRRVRILGSGDAADELFEALRPRLDPLDLRVERVREFAPGEFNLRLPAGVAVSPALGLALRYLTGQGPALEFLPPKVSRWQQLTAQYSSRKLVWAGATAGAVALVATMALLVQQAQLWYWGAKWGAMEARVTELDNIQQEIRRYRPWFDESFRSLSVLRRLTEAFPEDGTVSAKSVELRPPSNVTCTGTARDRQALLRVLDKLRAAHEVSEVKVEAMRGRSPLEFTFNFRWNDRGGS